jgi:predicted MPP superfamily phosphohydrolase
VIFFIILTITIFSAYTYIGWRLIIPSQLGDRRKRVAWAVLLLFPLLVPLSFLLQVTMENTWWSDFMGWVAYISLGFFSILFGLLLTRDALWLITAVLGKVRSLFRSISHSYSPQTDIIPDPDRRRFLIRSMNLGVLGLSTFMTGYGIYEARRLSTVIEVSVPISNLPPDFDGFRIAQISDIHVGPTIKHSYVRMIVDQVNRLGADLIALTGDLADGSVAGVRNEVLPLKDLHAPHGSFFVTGNHEYYSGAEAWVEEVDRLGFTVLINGNRILRRGSSLITLAGVTDHHAGRFIASHSSSPAAALDGAPGGSVKILLAHQPRSINAAAQEGYDLQVSGHTHGGQYFYGNLLVALSQPFLKGLHKQDNTWIYINSGTGYWGPPLRLGVPSEITLITLTAAGVTRTTTT